MMLLLSIISRTLKSYYTCHPAQMEGGRLLESKNDTAAISITCVAFLNQSEVFLIKNENGREDIR